MYTHYTEKRILRNQIAVSFVLKSELNERIIANTIKNQKIYHFIQQILRNAVKSVNFCVRFLQKKF